MAARNPGSVFKARDGSKAETKSPAYGVLLGMSGLLALAAVITLIPNPGASWPNLLGYKSICTFTPGSTFACALLAAIVCAIRARFVRRAPKPAFVTITVIVLLAGALAWSTIAWAGVKARSTDATSSATVAK